MSGSGVRAGYHGHPGNGKSLISLSSHLHEHSSSGVLDLDSGGEGAQVHPSYPVIGEFTPPFRQGGDCLGFSFLRKS